MGKGGDASGSVSVPVGTDFLNALVDKKITEFKEKAARDKTELGDEVKFAINEQARGSSVYHHRVKAVVYFIAAFAGFQMCYNLAAGNVSLPLFVLMLGINFIYYDIFSGVLHIVLDEPQHIFSFPHGLILGPAAAEFQWHHFIPQDICTKPFVDACGDLNLAVSVVFSINLLFLGTMETPVGRCFMAMKLLAAYYGQYCHMMAHMPSGQRPGWVQWAQDHRLMISGEDHMVHHKNYDQNFCIGPGICNPAFMAVIRFVGRSPTFWLYLFYAMMILDVPIFLHLIQKYAVPYIN